MVEVTQADRDAAAQFVALLPYEEHPFVQAFARHRIEATTTAEAENARLREAIRNMVAKLYCASGCSCCRDDDAWHEASSNLAAFLDIPPYADGSGPDWYSVRDAALTDHHAEKEG